MDSDLMGSLRCFICIMELLTAFSGNYNEYFGSFVDNEALTYLQLVYNNCFVLLKYFNVLGKQNAQECLQGCDNNCRGCFRVCLYFVAQLKKAGWDSIIV